MATACSDSSQDRMQQPTLSPADNQRMIQEVMTLIANYIANFESRSGCVTIASGLSFSWSSDLTTAGAAHVEVTVLPEDHPCLFEGRLNGVSASTVQRNIESYIIVFRKELFAAEAMDWVTANVGGVGYTDEISVLIDGLAYLRLSVEDQRAFGIEDYISISPVHWDGVTFPDCQMLRIIDEVSRNGGILPGGLPTFLPQVCN